MRHGHPCITGILVSRASLPVIVVCGEVAGLEGGRLGRHRSTVAGETPAVPFWVEGARLGRQGRTVAGEDACGPRQPRPGAARAIRFRAHRTARRHQGGRQTGGGWARAKCPHH